MKEQISKKVNRIEKKSVLDHLLKQWNLNYNSFSKVLGISHKTLWGYRKGQSQFRLTWEQIQILEKLLQEVGLTFQTLDPDWIKDVEDDSKNLDERLDDCLDV